MDTKSSSNGDRPFVSYVRISNLGVREAGNNLSAEKQLASITATAKRHDLTLNPDWVFSDEDISGQTFQRVGWEQVVELIGSGQAGGVVVWNQARASRAKAWETMAMIAAVEEAGGEIYAQDGQITVATFQGQVMAFFNGAMDNKFAVEQGEALRGFVQSAVARGAHLQAPYGYAKADRVHSRAMPLVINEAEAVVVREMFALRAAGMSWTKIAAQLTELGHQPRPHVRHGRVVQGGWRHQAIAKMVASKTYLGTAWNGEQELPGAHPAIVAPELWLAANQTKGTKPVGPAGGYALSGLVRCASCGYVMQHSGSYWTCKDQAARKCPARVNVPDAALRAWVVGEFKATYLTKMRGVAEEADSTVDTAQAAVDVAGARYEAAMEMKMEAAAGGVARAVEIATSKVTAAAGELAAAERALAEARAAALGVKLPPWLTAEGFDGLPAAEQNRWLEAVYAFVSVRRSRVQRGPIADRARIVKATDLVGDPITAAAGIVW